MQEGGWFDYIPLTHMVKLISRGQSAKKKMPGADVAGHSIHTLKLENHGYPRN